MKTKSLIIYFLFLAAITYGQNTADLQKINIDLKKSSVEWTGKKLTGEHYGNILLSNGQLLFEGQKFSGGSLEIDMNSITCVDITDEKSNRRLVDHLKSEDFFSVNKYPKAKFDITKVEPSGIDNYKVTGNLTIKGIARSLSFAATITNASGQIKAEAKMTFDRSKYDVKFGSQSFFENLGDKLVYDDVDMKVVLIAEFPSQRP